MKLSILICFGIFLSVVQTVDAITRPRVSARQLAARRRVASRPVTRLRTLVVPVITKNGERRRVRVIPVRSRSTNAATNIRKTNVNKKKDIKQTIIIAKTANIMSHVGTQNNDKTAISNKGSGSVQNSKPPKNLSIKRSRMLSKSRRPPQSSRRQRPPSSGRPSRRPPSVSTGGHGGSVGMHGVGSGSQNHRMGAGNGHGQPVTIHIANTFPNNMGTVGHNPQAHGNGHMNNGHGGHNFGGHGSGMHGQGFGNLGNGMGSHGMTGQGHGMGSHGVTGQGHGMGSHGMTGQGQGIGTHGTGIGPSGFGGQGNGIGGHSSGFGTGFGQGGFGSGHGHGGGNAGQNLGLPVGHGIDFASLLGPLVDQGGVGAHGGQGFNSMGHGGSGPSSGVLGGTSGSVMLDQLLTSIQTARSNTAQINAGLLAALVASGNLGDNLAVLALLNSLNNQPMSVTSSPLFGDNIAHSNVLSNSQQSHPQSGHQTNHGTSGRHGAGQGSANGKGHGSGKQNGHNSGSVHSNAGVTSPTIVSAGGLNGPIILETGSGHIQLGLRQNQNGPPSLVIGHGGASVAMGQRGIEAEELV